ncbi:MAG TPA: methionine sulfoxide reductase, partial [Erysipelotrichaceae bacterium]|nr:methionine sulfoxide reductase [Erysipelotrichaceae bacterium]
KLVDCKNIDYLKQSGVYFLFSKGDGDKPLVYVGQSGTRKNGEGILNRLKEHHASPKQGLEDWYEAVAFTT